MGRNREAFEATLATLVELGRVDPIDRALVVLVGSLADAVDESPGNAQLWRQYRDALADLVKVEDDGDSSLDVALAALRGATPVGDASAS